MANRSQPLSNPTGSSGVPMTALWLVIVCGCLISLLSFGPRSVLGLFLVPMTEAQGWSREVFALSLAIQNLIWGIGQPFAGAVADRYGTGRVLALGGLIYAGGLVLMAWAPTPAWLHVSAGLMIGLGMAAASFSIVLAAFGAASHLKSARWCSALARRQARWGSFCSRRWAGPSSPTMAGNKR